MNIVLKTLLSLKKQSFQQSKVDLEITDGILSNIGPNIAVKDGYTCIEKRKSSCFYWMG